MKNKNNCVQILDYFFNYVKTQLHTNVNAKELCAGHMLTIYKNNDIILHRRSCSETPQQNGIVECKHKHLLETAHGLSFQSNFPYEFWGDSVLCAAYLINRL